MTEVAELVAGRELDALVAERVIGMTNVELRLHVQGEGLFGERDGFTEWVPTYSTDIAAAWQVVEKMRASVFPERMGWRAVVRGPGVYADTAPLAICRAALAAVNR